MLLAAFVTRVVRAFSAWIVADAISRAAPGEGNSETCCGSVETGMTVLAFGAGANGSGSLLPPWPNNKTGNAQITRGLKVLVFQRVRESCLLENIVRVLYHTLGGVE